VRMLMLAAIAILAASPGFAQVPLPFQQPLTLPSVTPDPDQLRQTTHPAPTPDLVPFVYLRTRAKVTADPDKIWETDELEPWPGKETVTIQEYAAENAQGRWIISQVWGGGCSTDLCPTRLVLDTANGEPHVKLTDMLHQVIPPELAERLFTAQTRQNLSPAYLRHPFALSADGKTLINGNLSFKID